MVTFPLDQTDVDGLERLLTVQHWERKGWLQSSTMIANGERTADGRVKKTRTYFVGKAMFTEDGRLPWPEPITFAMIALAINAGEHTRG